MIPEHFYNALENMYLLKESFDSAQSGGSEHLVNKTFQDFTVVTFYKRTRICQIELKLLPKFAGVIIIMFDSCFKAPGSFSVMPMQEKFFYAKPTQNIHNYDAR